MGFELTTQNDLNRMALLIVAESGTGKTSQCMNLNPEEVAFVSVEPGELCFKKTGYMPRLRSKIRSSNDLADTFVQLNDGIDGIKYVFVDSLTELGEMIIAELKLDPRYSDPKNILKMYGTYNDMMTKIIKSYRDLDKYTVIFTCLSHKEKDGVESFDDYTLPGAAVKNNLKAWFDLVLHMQCYKDGEEEKRVFLTNTSLSRLAKDRSGLLNEIEEANIGEIIERILK